MNYSPGKVLRHLAGNENIKAIALDDLKKLAEESPYFPVAQLLLAKKLKAESNTDFLPQAQKTALYFSNPYWLHYQLTDGLSPDTILEKNNFAGEDLGIDQDLTDELPEKKEVREIISPFSVTTSVPDLGFAGEKHQIFGGTEEVPANEPEQANATHSVFVNENAELETKSKENATQPEEEMAALVPEPDKNTDRFLDQLDSADQPAMHEDNEGILPEKSTPPQQKIATEVLEEMAGVSRETDEATEAFLEEAQTSGIENVATASKEIETEQAQPYKPPSVFGTAKDQKDENGEPDEHERMFQNIKAMLDATSEEADADTENAVIPIDPYYTIDYFASQGIKLELEQNPRDQLGQNLKKFTQWLKHMKKLGPEDATEVISRSETEADIQKSADASNTVREVVTEAMALVLEKQGKKDKAIELYKKLSFLNPDKSAYFAGKIKNLKGI